MGAVMERIGRGWQSAPWSGVALRMGVQWSSSKSTRPPRMTPKVAHTTKSFVSSSRRRRTTWPRDWSSDVCSSDLRWYALAYIAGIVLGWWGVLRVLRQKSLWAYPPFNGRPPATEDDIGDLVVWATLGVILGGRLG